MGGLRSSTPSRSPSPRVGVGNGPRCPRPARALAPWGWSARGGAPRGAVPTLGLCACAPARKPCGRGTDREGHAKEQSLRGHGGVLPQPQGHEAPDPLQAASTHRDLFQFPGPLAAPAREAGQDLLVFTSQDQPQNRCSQPHPLRCVGLTSGSKRGKSNGESSEYVVCPTRFL